MAVVLRKTWTYSENAALNIAVIGECGSGRSSFINAIRGLDDEDENAAVTGVVEISPKPVPYAFPTHPNVTIWKLRLIGGPMFEAGSYLQQVNFSCYDIFIVIVSERFRLSHFALAREIQRMGKKCYFVRSKTDVDLQCAARRRPSSYNEEAILQEIREYCWECLQEEGVKNPEIFLISNRYLARYDFHLLQETLMEELSSEKNHALLLALPSYSNKIIEKKKEVLKEGIWRVAAAACVGALVPIPGVSAACNVAVLVKNTRSYSKNFGLDRDSFSRLSKRSQKSTEELERAIVKTRLAEEINQAFVITLLATVALALAGSFFLWVPVIGMVVNAGLTYKASYRVLDSFLEDAAEDAKNVQKKAWDHEIPAPARVSKKVS
ncbi:interferon-inducible GTPase 5-like [Pelodiscus sinensis]|uniref:interferon-inducible GTPase 5-like n=1 Tax=Pelodiscus sinensis TaxID=13735 RepID=UPI003F6A6ECA